MVTYSQKFSKSKKQPQTNNNSNNKKPNPPVDAFDFQAVHM